MKRRGRKRGQKKKKEKKERVSFFKFLELVKKLVSVIFSSCYEGGGGDLVMNMNE